MNETEKKYTIIEVNFREATEVGKNSIKFTEISRNNIQHKMKVIGHIENGVSIPATTPDLVIPEAPVAKVKKEKEIVPEVTTVNTTDENFRVISNPKKLKLPNGTFVTVKEATTMKLANEATRTELSPHYSSLVSEPVVEKPTIEESKEEEAKLDGPIWNVKEEPEIEPIVDTPEPIEEEVENKVFDIPQVESPKEEIPVNEIPQGVKPYENSFTPTDTPSIATGLEESDLAKKAREAIQARIEAAKKKATQEAEAEIAKANAEAAKAREEAAQAKKDKETVEEELSKTRSDLNNLSEEVRKAQQEAISAKTKIAAYEEVFKEFTSPVDDTPLSRAA